ncbi:morphogenic membrane protein MmpB [Streptomyces sp. URMC 123]
MLWSDPPQEPPEEMRQAQAMLRRVGTVIVVALVVLMFVIGPLSTNY